MLSENKMQPQAKYQKTAHGIGEVIALKNKPPQQLKKIIEMLNNNSIIFEQIIQNHTKIAKDNLNRLGVKYENGSDNLGKSLEKAHQLYELAVNAGCVLGLSNQAGFLIYKKATANDFDKALELLNRIPDSQAQQTDKYYLIGEAYTKKIDNSFNPPAPSMLKELHQKRIAAFNKMTLIKENQERDIEANEKEYYKGQVCIVKSYIALDKLNEAEGTFKQLPISNQFELIKNLAKNNPEMALKLFLALSKQAQNGEYYQKYQDIIIAALESKLSNYFNSIIVSSDMEIDSSSQPSTSSEETMPTYHSSMDIDTNSQEMATGNISKKLAVGWYEINDKLVGFCPTDENYLNYRERVKALLEIATLKFEPLNKLYTRQDYYCQNKIPDSSLKTKFENHVKALSETKEKLKEIKTRLEQMDKNLEKAIEYQQIKRQLKVESKFFSPQRTKKSATKELALKLQRNRMVSGDDKVVPINDVQPSRRWITAERAALMIGNKDLPKIGYSEYARRHYWFINKKNEGSYQDSTQHYSNHEIIQRGGELKYKQRVDSHYNHRGDYNFKELGAYSDILKVIIKITESNSSNEIELAKLMLKSIKTGAPITLAELQAINSAITDNDEDTSVIDINRIVHHCFIKEPVRWMFPHDKNQELPLATAQARALQLIIKGYLSLKDVFGQKSAYGIFTDKLIGAQPEELKKKYNAINHLYEQAILLSDNRDKYLLACKDKKVTTAIATTKQLREELRACYGGESDTDSDEYSSDEEDSFSADEKSLFSHTI
jgi:hypothetical protein